MDMNIKIPALEKLLDYTASGIGSVAGSMLAPWKASRDARAKVIAAKGEVKAQRILAEGRADTMQIIATAQADARSALISPAAVLQGEIAIPDLVSQRIQFQEEKRQANIRSVVAQAAYELGDREIQDNPVDHDWTARFFNDVQDVSSEEMQRLWAKVLAGEVERPGSTSFKAMNILKGLDQTTATLFRTLCSARMTPLIGLPGGGSEQVGTDIVLSLEDRATGNSLQEYGLSYVSLNRLNEHGLIVPEYNSIWVERVVDAGLGKSPRWNSMAFGFQDRIWVLVPIDNREGDFDLEISGILLTHSGMELARTVEIEAMPEYQQAVAGFFEQKGLSMSEVDFGTPHTP